MSEPKVSVVIVSRDRPEGLARLLTALRFQFYRNFEVIVVSNIDHADNDHIKYLYFDEPNISAARNLGIEASAGDLVAFCDDDAVPEPTWLEKLIAPFESENIGLSGGFVRGRNGIDFQWKALQVNVFGIDKPLEIENGAAFQVALPEDGYFAKVQGTNCMFRKSMLFEIGGFDENFQFYLDETDVCVRAALAGWDTAIVPNAEVQHGFEESDRRTESRVPRSLYAEGKSKAYFCKKQIGDGEHKSALTSFEKEQHKRLISLMVDGFIEPKAIHNLLSTLQMGFKEGQDLSCEKRLIKANKQHAKFSVFNKDSKKLSESEAIVGSLISRREMVNLALDSASNNIPCTVMRWSFTALFHRRYFDIRGFWVQTGGLFGKSDRSQPYFKLDTIINRGINEVSSLEETRKIKKISFFRFKRLSKVIK